jgi:hypothetical protein
MCSILCAIGSFVLFVFSAILTDPGVTKYNYSINIAAISLLVGSINVLPLLVLVFQQDRSQKSQLKDLLLKITESIYTLKKQIFNSDVKLKDLKMNKLLHGILGEMYTINPKVPVFSLSTTIQDFSFDTIHPDNAVKFIENDAEKSILQNDDENKAYFVITVHFMNASEIF